MDGDNGENGNEVTDNCKEKMLNFMSEPSNNRQLNENLHLTSKSIIG
jgi:hypothetical protein